MADGTDPHDILRDVTGLFFTGRSVKPKRRKPNRCLGCGKVTKHIFCPGTYQACRALYDGRTK